MIDSLILTLVKMTFSTADLVEFRTLLSIGWNPAQIFPWLPIPLFFGPPCIVLLAIEKD